MCKQKKKVVIIIETKAYLQKEQDEGRIIVLKKPKNGAIINKV